MKTFRELYCARHGLRDEQFERAVVWQSLHWQAKPLWWLLRLNHNYVAADFAFVRAFGALRRRRYFGEEAAEFHYHPGNRGWLRQVLQLRVSGSALRSLFEKEVENEEAGGDRV